MLKKILVLIMLAIMTATVMSSCPAIPYAGGDESSVEQTTTTPPTTTVDKWAISAQLAQLIKEDNSGILNIFMKGEEIARELDKAEIPYEKHENNIFLISDGSVLMNESFSFKQSNKGLKIDDEESKIIELYGEPDSKESNYSVVDYKYIIGESPLNNENIVIFTVRTTNNKVTDMFLILKMPDGEGGLND